MGQGAYIAFDVVTAFQTFAHIVHGLGQLAQLAWHGGNGQRRRSLLWMGGFMQRGCLHVLGVVAQPAHMHHKPPGYGAAHSCRDQDKQQPAAKNLALCAVDDFLYRP